MGIKNTNLEAGGSWRKLEEAGGKYLTKLEEAGKY